MRFFRYPPAVTKGSNKVISLVQIAFVFVFFFVMSKIGNSDV